MSDQGNVKSSHSVTYCFFNRRRNGKTSQPTKRSHKESEHSTITFETQQVSATENILTLLKSNYGENEIKMLKQ